MNRHKRLMRTILGGRSDANIRFADFRALMRYLEFDERIRGSHHVYRRHDIPEKVNLQREDGNAKPYQVRQFRRLALKYQLEGEL